MEIKKAGFPYLIDMSISTACPFACQFCYTSSTKKGKDAETEFITDLIPALFHANVLEVVLGGGEPTLAKDFVWILEHLKGYHFKVGVTTKNYMLHKHERIDDILENTSSLAFSCNTIEELQKVKVFRDELKGKHTRPQIYVQNILGLHDYEQLKEFLTTAKSMWFDNVTLLGYKDFGFGKNVQPNPIPDEWVDFVKELGINIGIDSILAQRYQKLLIDKGVEDYMLVGAEGKASCYIDAVNKHLKRSSFTDEFVEMLPPHKRNGFEPETYAEYFLEEFSKL